MKIKDKLVQGLVMSAVLTSVVPAMAGLIDFDQVGDFDGSFVVNASVGGYVETDGIGLDGSRAVDITLGGGVKKTALYANATTSSSSDISQSIFFKYESGGLDSNIPFLLLGVADSTDGNFSTTTPDWLAAGLKRNTSLNTVRLFISGDSDLNTDSTTTGSVVLSDGAWYYLDVLMSSSEDQWDVTVSLFSADSSGTVGSQLVTTSATKTFTTTTSDFYTGFMATGGLGLDVVDNYSTSAVPEPTTVSLVLFSGLFAVMVRRSRCY